MNLPTLEAEERFWARGMRRIAGLDEAGRGAWAGPVVAAAVILPCGDEVCAALAGVRDSKQVSSAKREVLAVRIREVALAVGVGRGEQQEIDALGIVPATRLAMQRALAALSIAPEALIVDALPLPAVDLPQDVFPYADARSLSVAAASIIAKVSRDRWMVVVAEVDFPGYGFAQHKGYGTRQHRAALERLGICPIHRLTFRPVTDRLSAD
ncbi:MAG: ribonuclease HII [Anaerolineae bacterium]|nr:ribonuclease HII [Anaerolineae bacterium]